MKCTKVRLISNRSDISDPFLMVSDNEIECYDYLLDFYGETENTNVKILLAKKTFFSTQTKYL